MKQLKLILPIATIILVIIAMLFLKKVDHTLPESTKRVTKDTIDAKLFIALADSIRDSTPDTAIIYYNKAVELLQPMKKGFWENQILTSAYVGMAFTHSQLGDNDVAFKIDSMAVSIAAATNNKQMQAKALNVKALILARKGDFKNALNIYREAFDFAIGANDLVSQAKISSNMAQVNSFLGDYEKAIEGFSRALEIGKQLKNNQLIAGCNLNLGVVFNYYGDNKKSQKNYEDALQIYLNVEDKNGILLCYQSIGNILFETATYDKAIEFFQKSLDIALLMNDKQNTARGYYNLAEVYAALGDNKMASDLHFKSLKIKEEIGDKMGLVNEFNCIGSLYFQRNDYNDALEYYKKALSLSQELGYEKGIGNGFSNLAIVYSTLGIQDSLFIYYSKAKDIYQALGSKSNLANVYSNLGGEFVKKKDFKSAEKYLMDALKIKTELDEVDMKSQLLSQLADMYMNQALTVESIDKENLLHKAEISGLEAYNIAKRLNSLPIIHNASHVLEQIYFQMGNLSKAMEYSGIYEITNDSLFSRDKTEALTFARARWDVGKKQQEIDNLENAKKLQQKIISQKITESRQQRIIIWIIVALLVMIIGFTIIAGLYFRKKRDMLYQKQLANITMLRMQNIRNAISPHFVFNVLNNIWAIIDDRENARAQFDNLVTLIRRSLINTEKLAIPLNDEIDFVKSFLELQKLRMDNNLEVVWNIENGIDLNQLVPGMILQIPVENAIKHGLVPKKDNRILNLDISTRSGFLQFIITDNGIGLQYGSSSTHGTGTGLKVLTNTIHILNQTNEKKMTYEILNRNDEGNTGAKVIIKIPLLYNYNLG
jgi:tetratricopeptide (TPR) repeat protein